MSSAGNDQWTVRRLLEWTDKYFRDNGLEDSLLAAQLLLAKALECKKVDLYLRFDEVVADDARQVYRDMVQRAAAGEPIAFLIGSREFFSLEFDLRPGVLIPRPETELLVQWVIRKVRSDKELSQSQSIRILELGTGSGCVAVSLARFMPTACLIIAADVSGDAVALADQNRRKHDVTDSVCPVVGDLLAPFAPGRQFDFIVANLPYVTDADFERLPKHIKDYEPAGALRAGPEGLAVIEPAISQAWQYLKIGGYLALEIGYNQAAAVGELLRRFPYEQIEFEKDYADISRVAIGRVKEAN